MKPRSIFWQDLTWPEIRELDRDKTIIILPVGSCEQHSLHLPLGMDSYSAQILSKDVAHKLNGRALVMPPIWYGASEHHMDFDGTITLKHETLIAIIQDIAYSLHRHGFKNIVVINGHGGNTSPIEVALRKIREEIGLRVVLINPWELITNEIESTLESDIWGHACEFETSEAMWIIPDKVREEAITDPKINMEMHNKIKNAHIPWHTIEITNTGSIGYPTKASKEKGEKLYLAMLEKTVNVIVDTFKF
ncbi:MAG: creatininase family protein [Candidatus Njordarchaeia archaeon]